MSGFPRTWMARLAACCLALGISASAIAQSARVRIEADSVYVGERFRLVLRVESESGAVVPPDPGPVGPLELLREIGRGSTLGAPLPPGVRRDTFVYEAAAFALDTLVVPPLFASLVTGAETLRVASAPLVLPMRRRVADSTAALRPTRPIESFGFPWWLLTGIGLLVAALAYFGWRAWRRRPPPPTPVVATRPAPPTSARSRYLRALDGLETRLPESVSEARTFALALADAVRTYAEEQADVHAKEMTSGALVRALERLERTRRVAPGTGATARRVLTVADLGRYASTCPPRADTRAALEAARALAPALDAPRRAPATRPAIPATATTDAARPAASGPADAPS